MYQSLKEKANRVADLIDGVTGKVIGVVGGSMVAASASAAPVDVSTLTAAVDYSTVIAAVLAVGALAIAVYVAMKATRMVIGVVKGL